MSDSATRTKKRPTQLTPKQVKDYLQEHPDFLAENPQLLEALRFPASDTGNGKVIDFQSYALSNLQEGMRGLKDKFHGMLLSARDNMSIQNQVHHAVLTLLRAHDLENLLERLASDIPRLFNLDLVRLAMESEVAEFYETYTANGGFAGMAFVPLGTIDAMLGIDEPIQLITDSHAHHLPELATLTKDCRDLTRSVALLRLVPQIETGQQMVLILGVRDAGHFQPGQGTDLLSFLAAVVEIEIARHLREGAVEKLR